MNSLLKHARQGLRRTQGASLPTPTTTQSSISLTDRLRSGYHRFWYEASQVLGWTRGTFRETADGFLPTLLPAQRDRIEELVHRYETRFEMKYQPETALLNYVYLDLLDRATHALHWTVPLKEQTCDLGSANFAYAAALHTFFQPETLVGVEVDGHRLYCNGRSRIDYAHGHIQDLPATSYVVNDYREYNQSAQLILAWYPFVTPKPLLAWRLPLTLFDPAALFAKVATNLIVGGQFIMVNHSPAEAKIARGIAEDVGLVCTGQYVHETSLRPRMQHPVLTLWHHS